MRSEIGLIGLCARYRGGDGAARGPGGLADVVEVDLGHRDAERMGDLVGELVVAGEIVAQPTAPGGDAAARMQFERRLATVERRGDVIPGHLQQGGTLQCGVATAAKR